MPPWRTVYGWFRRWLDLGLFDRLMCEVAMRRRRLAGRRSTPTLGIIDTQTVKCIPVRGPRGYDAAKLTVGRKRVVLVDADGVWLAVNTVPASVQERDTLSALDVGSSQWPSLRMAVFDAAFTADRCREWANFHGMRPTWSAASLARRALSCCLAAGWSNVVSAGWRTGGVCCATGLDGWMSQPGAWLSRQFCPGFRPCSILSQFAPLDYETLTQTGSKWRTYLRSVFSVLSN
jgi:hypothetical protein